MSVGERIKARRKQIGMSAETLAERIGKSPATVYRYEKGDIDKIDSRIIPLIAKALSVEPAFLMGWGGQIMEHTGEMPSFSIVGEDRTLYFFYDESANRVLNASPDDKPAMIRLAFTDAIENSSKKLNIAGLQKALAYISQLCDDERYLEPSV